MTNEELDREIAEKVMGVDLSAHFCCDGGTPAIPCLEGSDMDYDCLHLGKGTWEDCKSKCTPRALPYSTSIAHAFEVVEKMITDKWSFNIETYDDPDPARRWFCEFGKGGEGIYDATSSTAARAICKAALKTTGADNA